MRRLVALIIGLFIFVCSIEAQPSIPIEHDQQVINYGNNDSLLVLKQIHSSSNVTYNLTSPDDVAIFIVLLKEEPLIKLKSASLRKNSEIIKRHHQIEMMHEKLISDIKAIKTRKNAFNNTSGIELTTVRAKYKTVLNGISIKAPHWIADEIRAMDCVAAVYENIETKIDSFETVSSIGAESVWADYGYTGKGVVIGIMDSGIDYMHPDLGGGIGPEFKVIGGYDFINGDSIPLDDNGHGTIVAGVAAANGVVKGIAPEASLLAIKTSNETGGGSAEIDIKGLEYALDPDGDPLTDDAADVINMSFGCLQSFYDPFIIAVNNAVSAGVVIVAGAGNDGPVNRTVIAPGIAENSITVGATNQSDQIAEFSARGPSPVFTQLKPDIVAQGVDINSTALGGGYQINSGTSLSTPVVSGAAALLLQKNPHWNTEMVKSCLMNNAKDIGLDRWTQGSGRLDVLKALKSDILVCPGSISFGLCPESEVYKDTLELYNNSFTPMNFRLSLSNDSPEGIKASFNPSSGTIQAGEKISVYFDLDISAVQNTNVHSKNWFPETGSIILNTENDSISVNYSFIKHPYLQLLGEIGYESPSLISDPGDVFLNHPHQITFGSYIFYVDPGIYHAFWDFGYMKTNFYENIVVDQRKVLTITKPEVLYRLDYQQFNEEDDLILNGEFSGFQTIMYHDTIPLRMEYTMFDHERYYSQVSDNFGIFYRQWSNTNASKVYYLNGFIPNLSQNQVITNKKSDLKQITYDLSRVSDESEIRVTQMSGNNKFQSGNIYMSFLQSPFIQDVYMIPEMWKSTIHPDHFSKLISNSQFKILALLPDLRYRDNKWDIFWGKDNTRKVLTYSGNKFIANLGPSHFFGKFLNEDKIIRLGQNTDLGYGPDFFTNQFQDNKNLNDNEGYSFKLYDANNYVLKEGIINWCNNIILESSDSEFSNFYFRYDLPNSGMYYLSMTDTNSIVYNKKSTVTVVNGFNTSMNDKNPPTITSFNIKVDNEFTDAVTSVSVNPEILFVIDDDIGLNNVTLSIKTENETTWSEIPLTIEDSLYTASFINTIPRKYDGFIDARLYSSDSSGNFIEQICQPAFYHKYKPFDVGLISGESIVCAGENGMRYSVNQLSIAKTYSWSYTGYGITMNFGNTNNLVINFDSVATSGDLSVTVTDSCGEISVSEIFPINIIPLPKIPSIPKGPDIVDLRNNQETEFSIEKVNDAESYLWVLLPSEAGVISGTDTLAKVIWNTDFIGKASIQVESVNSCSVSGLTDKKEVIIENTTSINEYPLSSLVIFPNPNDGVFYLKSSFNINNIVICDLTGRRISNVSYIKENHQIKHNLKNGIYFIHINIENQWYVRKFIVNDNR